MDCSLPGSAVHGILQARILECVAITYSRGIFPTQELNLGLLYCRQILYHLSHQGSPGGLRLGSNSGSQSLNSGEKVSEWLENYQEEISWWGDTY